MFEVKKQFRFEAAHSLPHLPDGHKCSRTHGHSYMVEIACRGELDERGFVIDYAEISEAVNPLIELLDHHNLNERFNMHTTAENLAKWFFDEVSKKIPVYQVHIYETPKTCCTYPAR